MKSPCTKLDPCKPQHHSIQEANGLVAFTKSEIKLNVVHAGLLVLQRLSQTDSALPQAVESMSSSLHKIWYHARRIIWPAKVVTSTELGVSLKTMVSQLTNASHINLVAVEFQPAHQDAPMVHLRRTTSAREAQLSKPVELKPPRISLLHLVQLRPVSPYMLTSSTTEVVSITTPQVVHKVVTPLKSLVGVEKVTLTTGL